MHNKRNRSIVSLLLIVAMLFTLGGGALAVKAPDANNISTWTGGTEAYTEGSGTAEDPYLIESAEQLAYLAAEVNLRENGDGEDIGWRGAFEGVYFRLVTDIDLAGLDWTAIGGGEYAGSFAGVFDGYGHVVENLYIDETDGAAGSGSRPGNNIGLFGKLEDTGVIRNLGIGSGYVAGHRSVGGLLGKNWGTVENCYNAATVLGTQSQGVGGVVGASWVDTTVLPQIVNCYNVGAVTSEYASGVAGGITGSNEGIIENCYNTAAIYSGRDAGGLAGENATAAAVVTSSYYVPAGDATQGVAYSTSGSVDDSVSVSAATAIDPADLNVAYRAGGDGPVLFWETGEAAALLAGTYSVTVEQPAGGAVSVVTPADYAVAGVLTYGSRVTLSAEPAASLESYLFKASAADTAWAEADSTVFVTGDNLVSARFTGGTPDEITLQFTNEVGLYTIVVVRGTTSLSSGAVLAQGDVLRISASVEKGTDAGDGLEYTGNYTLHVTGTTVQADGTYLVLGTEDVVITIELEIDAPNWINHTDSYWYTSQGASAEVYYIYSAGGLAYLAELVNEHGVTFAGKTVIVESGIDLSGKLWTPIGRGFNYSFQGALIGVDSTGGSDKAEITGINTVGGSAQGLFGFVRYGSVENLAVSGTVSGTANVGAITGWAVDGAVISNCVNNAAVTGDSNAGAIAGVLETSTGSELVGCSNGAGSVNGVSGSAAPLYGGVQ